MYLVSSLGNESSDLRLYIFFSSFTSELKDTSSIFLISVCVNTIVFHISNNIRYCVFTVPCKKKVKRVKEKLIECLAAGYAVLY